MDERLSDQLAKIRADHDHLIKEHRKLVNEYRKTIEHQPPLDKSDFRNYGEKLRAHLDALHHHHVAISRHHEELDAFHKSSK
jgi:hypothetical protein